jgi:hypothetical protein
MLKTKNLILKTELHILDPKKSAFIFCTRKPTTLMATYTRQAPHDFRAGVESRTGLKI